MQNPFKVTQFAKIEVKVVDQSWDISTVVNNKMTWIVLLGGVGTFVTVIIIPIIIGKHSRGRIRI